MTNRSTIRTVAGAVALLAFSAVSARQADAGSVLVAQPGNYQQGGCPQNSDVPDWTSSIRNGFAAMGWGVTFWTGPDAWPQDFVDPGDSADTFDVTVFEGHGNSGLISFSVPHDGQCKAGTVNNNYFCDWGDLSCSNIRMSSGDNARVSSAVFIACCYMEINRTALTMDHHFEKQLMGFGSLASLDSGMVSNYWNGTGGSSNVDSWLNNMEDRPGWFTGDNTTVVMSRGHSTDERWWNQTYCGLKRQNCVTGGEGGGYWARDWHWHGCSGCGSCPSP